MAVASRDGTGGAAREQTRARYPDAEGFIERDGVHVFWEQYGEGDPAILLMPTWSIIHSRHWKLVIPYLARHFRVVTFDGRGNGRSDRPPGPPAYAGTEFVADAVAVLDATGTGQAVVAGLSMGAGYAMSLAALHPDRALGLVLFGPAIPILDGPSDAPEAVANASFEEPQPDDEDWHRYNAHYWRRDWPGFAAWFGGEKVFSEPHSTKQVEDTVSWMLETDPETIIATERASFMQPPADWGPRPPGEAAGVPFARRVRCPALVVHGTADRIIPIEHGRRLAGVLGAPLIEVDGGGHNALGRDPVLVNLVLRDFVRDLATAP